MLKEPKKREAERVEEIAQFGGEDVKYTPRCHCHTPTAITMVANNNGVAWGGGGLEGYAGLPNTDTHTHIHTLAELKPQIRTLRRIQRKSLSLIHEQEDRRQILGLPTHTVAN